MKRHSIPLLRLTILLSFLIFSELYADPASNYDGAKEDLHVYLLIGQSNMAGRADFTSQDATPIPGVFLLNEKGEFEPATNPLNRHSTIRKKLSMQKMNPGFSFSQEMVESSEGISIGLVVNAKGGTKIQEWKKGTEFYNEAVKRTRVARKNGTLKGILWHQGEGNSGEPDICLGHLEELIQDLRNDLGVPNLPFVAGQIFYDPETKPHTKEINEEIAKLPATVPFTRYASSLSLTTYDNTHFDSEGMKALGKRYADEMIDLLKPETH